VSRRLLVALVLALFAAGTLAPGAQARKAVPDRLIVGFESGVSKQRQDDVLRRSGARLRERLSHIRAAVVSPRRSAGTRRAVARRLRALRAVRYVERDFYLRTTATPDDPMYPRQYALAAGGAAAVGAPSAWDMRTSCSKLAVLDTGIQWDHPDLSGNVWHNPEEVKGNGKDDDKNGYVDDYWGFNVIKGKGNAKDDNGHGTHVGGIIAGRGNNADGISGLCWTARIVPVKFMDSRGRGATSDAVTGIHYAVKAGAKIINCSFGSSSKSSSLADAVSWAKGKGAMLVVAAGNDGVNIDKEPTYPASYGANNILTVAAITSSGALASFSNFGSEAVDLGAPGDSILSTYPTSGYKTLSGTSMAAPIVAAAAAMLRKQDSGLSYGDIRSAIRQSTRANGALKKTWTGGQLDAAAALAKVR
jgi:subtilisin family serine protease